MAFPSPLVQGLNISFALRDTRVSSRSPVALCSCPEVPKAQPWNQSLRLHHPPLASTSHARAAQTYIQAPFTHTQSFEAKEINGEELEFFTAKNKE